MKRVRLQIQVLPWEESVSRPSRGAREHDNDIRPWLQPEDADNTLQQLVDNINQRYARIYIGRGALRIKELQDSWGSTLDLFDKVGDVFDDRSSSGENLTSICKVVRYPPAETELHDPQRFASLLPESAARPQKRPLPPLFNDFRRPLPSVEETAFNGRGSASKRRKIDRNATSASRARSQVSDPRPRKTPVSAQQSRDQEPILQVLDSQATQRREIGGLVSPSSEQALSLDTPNSLPISDSPAQDQTTIVTSSQEDTRSESPELTLSLVEASHRPQPHILSSDNPEASDQNPAESGSEDLPNVPHTEPEVQSTLDRDEIVDSTLNTQDAFKKPDLPRRSLRPLSAARLKMSNRASNTDNNDPIESDSESFKGRLMKRRLRRRKTTEEPSAKRLDSLRGGSLSPRHSHGVETGDQAQNQVDESHATAVQRSNQESVLTGSAEPSGPSQSRRQATTVSQAPASSDIIRESSLKGDASTSSHSIHPSTWKELPKEDKPKRNPSKPKGLNKDTTSNLRSQQEKPVDSARTQKVEHQKIEAMGPQKSNDEATSLTESDTSRQRNPTETETLSHSRQRGRSPIESNEGNDLDASDASRDSGPSSSVGSKPSNLSSGAGSLDSVLEDLNEASLHGGIEQQNGEHDQKAILKPTKANSDDEQPLQQEANPIEEAKNVERSDGDNDPSEGQQLLRSARARRNLKRGTKPLPNGTSTKQESQRIERGLKSERRSPQETIKLDQVNPAVSLEEKIKLHREQMLAEQAKIEMLARDGAKELAAEQARLKMKPMSAKTNGWTSGQDQARSMDSTVASSQVKSRRSSKKIKEPSEEPSHHSQFKEISLHRDSPSLDPVNGVSSQDLNKEATVHSASDHKQESKTLRPRRSTVRKHSLTPLIPDTPSPFVVVNPEESASPLQAKTARADRALQRNASQMKASALRESVSFAPGDKPESIGRTENGGNAMSDRADSTVESQPKFSETSSSRDSPEVNEDDDDEAATTSLSINSQGLQLEEQQPPLDEDEDDGASSFMEDEDVGWGAPVSASQSYKQMTERTNADRKNVKSSRKSIGDSQGLTVSKRLSKSSKSAPAVIVPRKKGKEVVREMPQPDAATSVTTSGSSSESMTDSQSTYILSDDDVPKDESEDKVAKKTSKRTPSTKAPKSKKSKSKATNAQASVSRASKATAASSKKAAVPSQGGNKAASPPPVSQPKTTDDQPTTKPVPSRSTSKSSYKYPTLSKLTRAAEGRIPTPPSSSAPALASRSFSSQPVFRGSSQQQQQQQQQHRQQQQQQQALHLGKQGPDSGSDDGDSTSSESSSDDNAEGGGAPVPAMPKANGASFIPGMKSIWNLVSASGSAR